MTREDTKQAVEVAGVEAGGNSQLEAAREGELEVS